MKVTLIPSVIGSFGRLEKETGRNGNRRRSRDHPNYSIIKIGQNTEKNPGDLRRLAVISHQLTLALKSLKRIR